jgi:hypothetical protein
VHIEARNDTNSDRHDEHSNLIASLAALANFDSGFVLEPAVIPLRCDHAPAR